MPQLSDIVPDLLVFSTEERVSALEYRVAQLENENQTQYNQAAELTLETRVSALESRVAQLEKENR